MPPPWRRLLVVPVARRQHFILRSARRTCPASRSRAACIQPPQDRSLEGLVAQVEAHLAKNPEDGRGWEVIAPVYLRLGRFEDAVKARQQCACAQRRDRRPRGRSRRGADGGRERRRHGGSQGSVRARARARRHPCQGALFSRPRGRAGRRRARLPRNLARHAGECAADGALGADLCARRWRASNTPRPRATGPSADDIAAAQQMTPEDRAAMVRGMVERLARTAQAGRLRRRGLAAPRAGLYGAGRDAKGARGGARGAPRARHATPTSCAGSTSLVKRAGSGRLMIMTRKQRRLVLIGSALARARRRGRARALRAAGLHRLLQFADRHGREARRAGQPHSPRRAGEARHAHARRQSQRSLRGDRRQQARSR